MAIMAFAHPRRPKSGTCSETIRQLLPKNRTFLASRAATALPRNGRTRSWPRCSSLSLSSASSILALLVTFTTQKLAVRTPDFPRIPAENARFVSKYLIAGGRSARARCEAVVGDSSKLRRGRLKRTSCARVCAQNDTAALQLQSSESGGLHRGNESAEEQQQGQSHGAPLTEAVAHQREPP
eukprot:scaffold8059_cov315-Pinguiococcus_pyrenoidosus.AAC.2